jgi:hypothetical protein
MRSSFNLLLVALVVLDSVYITTGIVDYSLIKTFGLECRLYTYLFPFLWHPVTNIIRCAIIFLTMGLATERFLAICR